MSKRGSRQSLVDLELEMIDQDEGSDTLFPVGLGCALDLFREKEQVMEIIQGLPKLGKDRAMVETTFQKYCTIIDRYQEQPHLLDPHMEEMINALLSQFRTTCNSQKEEDNILKHLSLKLLKQLFKVRGPKEVAKRMPHEISDLVPVLSYLENEDLDNPETWESGYVLVVWLSILVINPFHLKLLDGQNQVTIADRLFKVCKKCIVLNNSVGQAAPFLIAKFLTRPDMQEVYLDGFVDWACKNLGDTIPFGTRAGAFAALSAIVKQAKRQEILKYGEKMLDAGVKSKYEVCDSVLRKAGVKLIQRVGMMFLKTKLAPWRYQRGNRSLLSNLKGDTNPQPNAGVWTDVNNKQLSDGRAEDYAELSQYSSVIELVLDKLLEGLKDKYTIVRWSSAKGIGRVTNRLPKEYADQVVGGVLLNFSPRESHASWHGGCLALAELARRGLLLPERIQDVMPVVRKALVFDEIQGSFSIGGHVRDAACYVLWAFARAFDPSVIQQYVHDITTSLIIVMCFDREINCRRAASAAFQENVGRQGNFPHGIDIVTVADYFSVGMRTNAFVKVSSEIAKHKVYTIPMIQHLIDLKFNHFDEAVREVTALALGELGTFEPTYIREEVIPKLAVSCIDADVFTSHGALISLGHILTKLKDAGELELNEYILKSISNVIPEILSRKFKRMGNKGNEVLRQGVAVFISCCAKSKMPYYDDEAFISSCHSILEDTVSFVHNKTRETAAKALAQFLPEFYYNNPAKREMVKSIVEKFCRTLRHHVMVARQGFALTLGRLPIKLIQDKFREVVESLLQCSKITPESDMWAESRRDALDALSRIFLQQRLSRSENWDDGTPLHLIPREKILNVLLESINDYTTDKRGDIGSWVRVASGTAFRVILVRLNECDALSDMDPAIISKIIGNIAKQSVEKIDNVRMHASQVFATLIHQKDPPMNVIPRIEDLKRIFDEEFCKTVNWRTSSDSFPKFVEMLSLQEYTYPLLEGFVISGGSLSDSVMKDANAAITSYLIGAGAMGDNDAELNRIGGILLKIFENNLRAERVTIPLMNFVTQLLQSGTLQPLLCSDSEEFGLTLIDLTRNEIAKSGRVDKIILGVELLCEMLQGCESIVRSCLRKLVIYLAYAFPRVRLVTSQKLYEAILTYGADALTTPDQLDQAISLLTETQWELGQPQDFRPVRNQICQCLNIPEPVALHSTSK